MKNLIVLLILWGSYVNMYSQTPNISFKYTTYLSKKEQTDTIKIPISNKSDIQQSDTFFKDDIKWITNKDTIIIYKITDNIKSYLNTLNSAIKTSQNIVPTSANNVANKINSVIEKLDSNKSNLMKYTATIAVTGLENKSEIHRHEFYHKELDKLRIAYRSIALGLYNFFILSTGANSGEKEIFTINETKLKPYMQKLTSAIREPNGVVAFSACSVADTIYKIMVDLNNKKKNLREYTATIAVTGLENKEEIDLYEYYYEKLDSLRKCYRAINKIYGNPAFWNRFLPARTKVEAAMIYNRYGNKFTQVGQNISLYGWSNKGSVNAELFSTYLKGAKLSINTVVSSVDTAQDNAALLRTITGGAGNFIVNLNIPLYHCLNKGTKFFVEFSPNFASNIPLLGTPFKSSDLFFNSNLGANLSFSFRVAENSKISIYGYARPSYIVGSNSYLNEMNVTSDFWLFQGQLGLDIPEIGRFGWSLPAFSSNSSISTNTMLLSFQVSPMSIVGK